VNSNQKTGSPTYEVLNPRGIAVPPKLTPTVERLTDLNDKTVYVINVTRKVQSEEVLEGVATLIRERYPRSKVVHVLRKNNYYSDEPELWKEAAEKGDAVIVGPGD
jgi:hypothetical protein